MILFECDIGYIPGYSGDYVNKTIDEITIADSNRYLGIITQYDGNFPNSSKTVEEFNAAGVSSFGDDFYKIWLIPYSKDYYTNTVWGYGWVSSAPYMYPNIWGVVNGLASGGRINPIIIFRKLRKAISRDRCYEIRNNTFLSSGIRAVPYYVSQNFLYPIIANYTPGMNLTTAQWFALNATTNTAGTRGSFVDTNPSIASIMAWLLDDNPTPDKEVTSEDPYKPGGESSSGGGTGDFDGTGDDIEIPNLPTLSAVDTGFITLFNPSAGELRSLATYMWVNPLFDLDAWKKLFADPMDAILGLSIVPVAVPNGGSSAVTVGNISTGVNMNKAAAQYVSVDCGTLNVNEFWGAYLDYDPYTKAEIYLPYIGTHPLAVDDIMGKSVHVVYHVDILSGACCAYVKCGGSVLYSFVGQCSCSIPITGNDWTNVVNGALSIAASIGTMVATGGATAPMATATIASTAVNSIKPNVEKSGSMGGMGGMLGVQTPYLILTRPRQALPARQNAFSGYPSFITSDLGDLTGYTEIDSVHLEGIPATDAELAEIESLLKSGVIF